MISRRDFLKTLSLAAPAALFSRRIAYGGEMLPRADFFGVHPFIDSHPDAVFIFRSGIPSIGDEAGKLILGRDLGRTLFVGRTAGEGGFPITGNIVLKPNMTCRMMTDPRYTIEGTQGIQTDSSFVEGVIGSIKDLGAAGDRFFIREVNCPDDFADGGFTAMAQRTGADLRDLSAPVGTISENDLHWVDVPAGVWFNRIPFLRPAGTPDSYLINIAKFKAHSMGLTLCAKNLQGLDAVPYVRHCTEYGKEMGINPAHIQPGAEQTILANYERRKNSVPRWDRPGADGGLWMETWASRCLDNNSVLKARLHIIEGITGRDGNFIDGPHNGLAQDFLSNIILFGLNPFHVDIVGYWLAGHEPGNIGLFHMAKERSLSSLLNPASVPLYKWQLDGTAHPATLTDYPRTPLLTKYLQRDYNGQSEAPWHLVNEPFDYSTVDVESPAPLPARIALRQNFPNPFAGRTSIEYSLPAAVRARIEIRDILGALVGVIAEGAHTAGSHMTVWNAGGVPAGIYFCRLLADGAAVTRRMVLLQ